MKITSNGSSERVASPRRGSANSSSPSGRGTKRRAFAEAKALTPALFRSTGRGRKVFMSQRIERSSKLEIGHVIDVASERAPLGRGERARIGDRAVRAVGPGGPD